MQTSGKNLFDAEKTRVLENWQTNDMVPGYLEKAIYVGSGKKVTISRDAYLPLGIDIGVAVALSKNTDTVGWIYNKDNKYDAQLTVTSTEDYIYIRCSKSKATVMVDLIPKIQIEISDKATPYEPYTGGKPSPSPEYPQEIVNVGKWNEEKQKYEVDIKVTGKNLYDEEYAKNIDNWMNAYAPGTTPNTYSVLPIYVGDATEVNFSIKKGSIANPAIVIGASLEQYGNMQGILYHGTNSSMSKYSFVLKPTGDYVYLRCNSAAVKDRLYIGLETQIEISNVRTSYQPYKEQTLTLTSDRPITKWDKLVEKDGHIGWLYGGKTIQSYNSEPIDTEYMSSTGSLTVGATVLYKLKTTEFIPLHQSEQNAIRALTTYYPTTVITADGGEVDPFIEVTYTADTKNYIDQKISAINKAIINTQKALL